MMRPSGLYVVRQAPCSQRALCMTRRLPARTTSLRVAQESNRVSIPALAPAPSRQALPPIPQHQQPNATGAPDGTPGSHAASSSSPSSPPQASHTTHSSDLFATSTSSSSSTDTMDETFTASPTSPSPASMFDSSHFSTMTPQLLLYFPLGLLLASFRMALWIAGIAADAPWFTNPTVVQTYLNLLGYSSQWQGLENLPAGRHILVSNHISVGDLMMLFRLPQRYVHLVTSALPEATTKTNNLPALLKPASPQVMEQLAQWASDMPVHIFPEGGMTNGSAMLRFSRGFTKLIAPGVPVVPVAIRLSNTFNISTHTLDSSFLGNLFWFSFSPATQLRAVVLPAMEPLPGEGRGAFAQRVQQAIAEELRVPVSDMTTQQKRKLVQAAGQKGRA